MSSKKKVKPPVKQGRLKYDWPSLKQEFFESDYLEVKAFFLHKYDKFTSAAQHAAVGWPSEKRQWRDTEVQLALQNYQSDRIAGLKFTLDKVVTLAKREIDAMAKKGVRVKSLVKLWELVRTESGLPKSISHNINDNTNIDLKTARESLLDRVNKVAHKK